MICQSNTTKLYYVYYCTRATCFDSYRLIFMLFYGNRSSQIDPRLKCLKIRCGIPNAYILDITMYKMHALFCSYCTIGILISKTLTGTYERGYTCVLLVISNHNIEQRTGISSDIQCDKRLYSQRI